MTGEPVRAGADNVIAQLKTAGAKLNSTNPDDYVDTSLLDDLKKQGVPAELEKKYGKR